MKKLVYRVLDRFPEPAFSALVRDSFADYEPSRLLTDVSREEATAKASLAPADGEVLRIGAFRGDSLVAWSCSKADGTSLQMINAGVAAAERRKGIYSKLVQMTIEHARSRGCVMILSRHAANNNAVIIAKLKRGFFVSGFEYSEVYGPLVRLTYLPGNLRRALYQARATPIRRAGADE